MDASPRGAFGLSPGIRRLGMILGLPLLDGVFVTLVIAGVLDSPIGILLVGTVVFGGSGTVAVVLAELADRPRRHFVGILLLGALLVPMAAIQAAVAPTLVSIVDVEILAWMAALVLVLLGAKMGSPWWERHLPPIGLLVPFGLVVSLRVRDGIVLAFDPQLALVGGAAAAVGVCFALAVLLIGCRFYLLLDHDRFRVGGGIALGVLGVSVVTPIPVTASVAALVLGGVFSIDGENLRRWLAGEALTGRSSIQHSRV